LANGFTEAHTEPGKGRHVGAGFTLWRMDQIEVTTAGLGTLATHCGAVSTGLLTTIPPPRTGPPLQATSAAVATAYAGLGAAAAALAGRIEVTGFHLLLSATDFDLQDHTAAQRLAAVGNSIPV
jgi:hypothetical protein